MEQEEQLLRKRLLELANQCWHRDIPVFSHFLNLSEQTVFHSLRPELPPVSVKLEGGYETAERKIVCFLPVMEEFPAAPVSAVLIRPKAPKYAGACTHRDYLGAVLNLGIERSQTGDILVSGQDAWVLCRDQIAPFIAEQLTMVRYNPVVCQIVETGEIHYTPRYREVTGSIASVRTDSLVSLAFGLSRAKAAECVRGERVFVNGRMILSSSFAPEEGALISVRHLGKFRYKGFMTKTKKGRDMVCLEIFE